MKKVGEKAPRFSGLDQHGEKISSTDLKGKKYLMVFYPRDLTPTCTVELCNIRDNWAAWQQRGFEIVGVSTDNVKTHLRFADRHQFPFRLIADEKHKVCEAFGVWGKKKFMGREFDGIKRTTFVVNEKGVIIHIFDKVKSKEHSQQIMQVLDLPETKKTKLS